MATIGKVKKNTDENISLHDLFRIIGDQMTTRDIRVLKSLYTGILSEDLKNKINDGYTFLLALEKIGKVDESNFKHLLYALRMITRHDLIQYVNLRKRKTVEADPVEKYLEDSARMSIIVPTKYKSSTPVSQPVSPHSASSSPLSPARCSPYQSPVCSIHSPVTTSSSSKSQQSSPCSPSSSSSSTSSSAAEVATSVVASPPCQSSMVEPPAKKQCLGVNTVTTSSGSSVDKDRSPKLTRRGIEAVAGREMGCSDREEEADVIRKKLTCDIRLRVRAEYCQHENALEGNIFSNKPDPLERSFEKFLQANTILKSRDLGSIICDIKFSELTYLDAFWRDYINGSLLEALKGVFITESLKQAVGHEAIKLLVNVDEDDYEKGRVKLLQNLTDL